MTRSPAMYNMHHALEGAFMNTKPKFADLVTFDQMYQVTKPVFGKGKRALKGLSRFYGGSADALLDMAIIS